MTPHPLLVPLLTTVASESDGDRALDAVVTSALEMTGSRHAILAILNESLGLLEVRHGAGEDYPGLIPNERLPMDVGREDGIIGLVAVTGAPYQSGDVSGNPHYRRMFESTQSELAVPVKDRYGRVQAVLNLESDRRDAYGEDDLANSVAVADLIRIVIDQRERSKREEALIQIGSSLEAVLTEHALVERVIHVAGEVLSFQASSVFLLDRRTDTFVLRGTTGGLRELVDQIGYARGEGFTGWVCDRGEPILLTEPQSDPRWRGKYVEIPSDQIASFLAVPILGRTGSLGAIRVLRRKTENPFLDNRFTDDDLRLVQAIAEQVATGLENLRSVERVIRSERMIAWGELSAKSSHMIGNRVFALKGDVNELKHLLKETPLDVPALGEVQESLAANVTRIEEILQDFRDFLTATQLTREPTDLNELVRRTVEEVFPRRTPVELELELGEVPPISVDGRRLTRAISELIENALGYMESGRLRVATDTVPSDAYAATRARRESRFARLEVEDSGPGVQPERKAMIFQPFHTGRVKGMGLGLSIVKGIVDAHGGEVFEAGEPGRGANFVILLPIES